MTIIYGQNSIKKIRNYGRAELDFFSKTFSSGIYLMGTIHYVDHNSYNYSM